jgi:autotransporter adhesin
LPLDGILVLGVLQQESPVVTTRLSLKNCISFSRLHVQIVDNRACSKLDTRLAGLVLVTVVTAATTTAATATIAVATATTAAAATIAAAAATATAVTAATATAEAATAAATAESTATTTAATATTATTAFAGLGFLHDDRATVDVGLVQVVDGLLGLFIIGHLDKGEATAAASFFVKYHFSRIDLAKLLKQ